MKLISIHALREEGDSASALCRVERSDFYPRPPRGGRLWDNFKYFMGEVISIHALREEGDGQQTNTDTPIGISIHALREEGDMQNFANVMGVSDFYPRPPRGGRPFFFTGCSPKLAFLSTPSARRATLLFSVFFSRFGEISIHALREEGDVYAITTVTNRVLFLSTPSARRAT